MQDVVSNTMRPWRDIARELFNHTDKQKITDLGQELDHAIKEQTIDDKPIISVPPLPAESN